MREEAIAISFSDLLLTAHLRSVDCAILDIGEDAGIWLPRSDRVTFHYVLQGSAIVTLASRDGSRQVHLEQGDFAAFVRGTSHHLRVSGDAATTRFDYFTDRHLLEEPPVMRIGEGGAARVLSGMFGGPRASDSEDVSPLPDIVVQHARLEPQGAIFPIYQTAAGFEHACKGMGGRAFIGAVAHMFFVELIRRARDFAPVSSPDAQTLRMPKITLALRLIDAAPETDWTIDSLAKEVGTSRSMLAKQFLTLMEQPPIRYLTTVRMNRAADMLSTTDLSIAEIGWRVGYKSPTAFARSFRRERAMTPRQFRLLETRKPPAAGGSGEMRAPLAVAAAARTHSLEFAPA